MNTKAQIGSLLVFVILLFYAGCSLLVEDKDEPVASDPNVTTNSIEGRWIEQGGTPREIVDISSNAFTLHEYKQEILSVRTVFANANVDYSAKIIKVQQQGASEKQVSFSLNGTELTLNKDSQPKKYIRHEGPTTHSSWNIVPYTLGKMNSGVPSGAWRSNSTTGDEMIFRMENQKLLILRYNSGIVYYLNFSYSINSNKDTILLVDEVDTVKIPYSFMNGTLKITNPEGGEYNCTPYNSTSLPDNWNFSEMKLDDNSGEKLPITGNWIIDNGTINEIIEIGMTSFKKSVYNPIDLMLLTKSYTYELKNSGDSIYLKEGNTIAIRGKIIRGSNNSSLTFMLSDESTLRYVKYLGAIPHPDWKFKIQNPLKSTVWISEGEEPEEILVFGGVLLDSVKLWSYNYSDSVIEKKSGIYSVQGKSDSLYLDIEGTVEKSGFRIEGEVLIIANEGVEYRYVRYAGVIPFNGWKEKKESIYYGTWVIQPDSSEVFVIANGVTIGYAYDAESGLIDTQDFFTRFNSAADSIYFTPVGLNYEVAYKIFKFNNAITLRNGNNEAIYKQYDGEIPLDKWLLTRFTPEYNRNRTIMESLKKDLMPLRY